MCKGHSLLKKVISFDRGLKVLFGEGHFVQKYCLQYHNMN